MAWSRRGADAPFSPVSRPPMGSVTERTQARTAAPAQRDSTPARIDLPALLVEQSEGSANHERAVAVRDDLGAVLVHGRGVPAAGVSPAPLAVESANAAVSARSPRSLAIARCQVGRGRRSHLPARSIARPSAWPGAHGPIVSISRA